VDTGPLRVPAVKGFAVVAARVDPEHVSFVTPFLSLRIKLVPAARVASMETAWLWVSPGTSSVVAEAGLLHAPSVRAATAANRVIALTSFIWFSLSFRFRGTTRF